MNDSPRHPVSQVIDPRDESRIVAALEQAASTGDFAAMRTRAFVYLLRDGALRTKAAVWLDMEEVVKSPGGRRIQILQEAVQRACEGNNYRERSFLLSDRTRDAIADYLAVARDGGWLAHAGQFEGPLWISTHHSGTQKRLSQRMAAQAWRTFIEGLKPACDYQLDDIVLTGRVELVKAARGNTDVLSEHANLSPKWAQRYQEHLFKAPSSARDALGAINKKRKQS